MAKRETSYEKWLKEEGIPVIQGYGVEDVTLLLDAMTGEHPGDPTSLPSDGTSFLSGARSGWRPRRVAVSRDLGITPVEPDRGRARTP